MRARARIYAAHPMTCYGSPHEVACLDALRKLVPGVLINPAEVFASSAEWLVSWPRLIRRLDAMVAFPASDGTVGAGVVRELLDAVVYGIPVAVLDGTALVELAGVDMLGHRKRTALQVGRLVTGRRISPPTFLSRSFVPVNVSPRRSPQ